MEARPVLLTLAAVAAAALGVSAWVHAALAIPFDGNRGTLLGQGDLFRIEAAVDSLAGVTVVILPRAATALVALAVAAGGAGILALTTLVPLDGTALGLPYLFEPAWYPDKAVALVSQLAAAGAAAILALVLLRRRPSRTAA